nr:ribosome biogenesis protein SLX9 homolog isoform X3 [Dasypus novemcinctus]
MGKVRGLRSRVHQAAVRPEGEAVAGPAPPGPGAPPARALTDVAGGKGWAGVSTDIFAKTQIDPRALVQRLELDAAGAASVRREIGAIQLAEQEHEARRRRRATAVVGDLRPLLEALPELLELEAGPCRPRPPSRRSSKPRPAELHRMSAAQRLQLLEEERTRFRELLASPAYRASPLQAIGQRLADQMRLEEGASGQL